MLREDRKFMELMECSAQLQNEHYKFQLPFKGKEVAMPNNRCIAVQRVNGLKEGFKEMQVSTTSILTSCLMSSAMAMLNKYHSICWKLQQERFGSSHIMVCTILATKKSCE